MQRPVSLAEHESGGVLVESQTLIDTPLYDAGVDRGAIIQALGDSVISSPEQLQSLVAAMAPGTRTTIAYVMRGDRYTQPILLEEDETLVVAPIEAAGSPLGAGAAAFRHDWLGSRR